MVDNYSETVDECPQIRLIKYCLHINGTMKNVRYTKQQGVSAVSGLLKYWSEWKDSWEFQYIMVDGCPLGGVPLYCNCQLQTLYQLHNFCIPD